MSTFILKIIACITMLIDHTFMIFVPFGTTAFWIGREIGRIAFPIYCFLLVEGFLHTSSRTKYLIRLFVFALISEFPFDLAVYGIPKSAELAMQTQNVMFTLFIGLGLLCIYDWLLRKYSITQPVTFNALAVMAIIAASGITIWLASDYSYVGILFILIFYLFRGKKLWIAAGLLFVILAFSNKFELGAMMALVPIFLYNGKEGGKKSLRYAFYAFYPVHLLILGLIGNVM
ncbi:MAG: hypothetical protein IJY09_00190 [Lachnospiraceae bacterium]|nr:hypothetical protein [Lachnospiraceae bacterium]